MGDRVADRRGPDWLGLGWVGSGVVAGAAAALCLGAVLGVLLSASSDRAPDDVGSLEVPLVIGIALGASLVLPAGVLMGCLLGLLLRAQAHARGTTPQGSALTGLVLGVTSVPALAAVPGMVADPSAAPALPALPVVAALAAVVGATGAGLALLLHRSATRLAPWPR